MKMTPVTSSNIAAIGYDSKSAEIAVQFKNGKTFVYAEVSEAENEALVKSESIGKHFNQFIKAVKVGRQVMVKVAMSDKGKIKLLREALELVRPGVYYNQDGKEICAGGSYIIGDGIDGADDESMQKIHEALEATKD